MTMLKQDLNLSNNLLVTFGLQTMIQMLSNTELHETQPTTL